MIPEVAFFPDFIDSNKEITLRISTFASKKVRYMD
jgi:hypothetical protein